MAERVTSNLKLITLNKEPGREASKVMGDKFLVSSFPFIGTFHSLGARILRREAKSLGRNSNFTIFDNDDSIRLLKEVQKSLGVKKDELGPKIFERLIGRTKNELLKSSEVALDTGNKKLETLFPVIYEAYESKLMANNAFDFDDLIQKPVELFGKNTATLEYYRNKFQCILVDEFQDINAAQYQFIKMLGEKHKNISVVGDDQQSIYGFRGSDFRNFLNFEKDWSDAVVILLEENYRSTANIIGAASAVIANNKIQKPKKLWTKNTPGEAISVIENKDEDGEAWWLAGEIEKIIKNHRPEKQTLAAPIAILYRTNSQSRPIEQALIEKSIPYQIFGGVRFYERKEIKDMVAAMRFAYNPRDEISLGRLKQNFLKKAYGRLHAELPQKNDLLPAELLGYVLNATDYINYLRSHYPNAEERLENIAALIAFAGEHASLGDFLEKITLLQASDASAKNTHINGPRVELMTIHTAKGLEFDTVFITGANEGLLPHQMSYQKSGNEGIEEERRLMYVAMTRAQKKLYISFYEIGSRFLYEIPGEFVEFKSFRPGIGAELVDDEERYITLD